MSLDDGFEDKKEDIEEGVQDFPENAAHWTGEKVCFYLILPCRMVSLASIMAF